MSQTKKKENNRALMPKSCLSLQAGGYRLDMISSLNSVSLKYGVILLFCFENIFEWIFNGLFMTNK